MRSYLLIHTEAGRAGEVAQVIGRDSRVVRTDTVAGAYDVIATTEGEDTVQSQALLDDVRRVPGVIRLVTCQVGSHEHLWEEVLDPHYAGV
jgi:hypothetical protein